MKRAFLSIMVAITLGFFLIASPVYAEDTPQDNDSDTSSQAADDTSDTDAAGSSNVFSPDICTGKAAESALCKDKDPSGNPLTGGDGAIIKIANIIAIVAGVGAVITIIVAGIRMIVGGGDSNAVAGARRAIIYALLGLIIIVTGRLIVGLIVGSL